MSFQTKIQADVLFCDLPLSWARNGWPSWSPLFCHNPLDMTRYRCFSGVRLTDQGPQRKRMVASLRDNEDLSASQPSIFTFSFTGLDPDGCLVADRIRIRTNKFWKPGCRQRQGTDLVLDDVPAKKDPFLRWRSVSFWQGHFNGCHKGNPRLINSNYIYRIMS